MSKKKKRLEQIRRNRKNVSFEDFVLVLEYYGFEVREGGKGSHSIAKLTLGEKTFVVTFVSPHGNRKFMHPDAVKELLRVLDDVEIVMSELEDEDIVEEKADDESSGN